MKNELKFILLKLIINRIYLVFYIMKVTSKLTLARLRNIFAQRFKLFGLTSISHIAWILEKKETREREREREREQQQ